MRILFVAPAYQAPRMRGSVAAVAALAEALAAAGHDVTVFATNSNSDERVDEDLDVPLERPLLINGVQVRYFRRIDALKRRLPFLPYLTRSPGWLYAPRLLAALRRQAAVADLVHTHMPFTYPTYAAAQVARQQCRPFFYHQHGALHPHQLQFRALKKRLYLAGIEMPILRRATTLVALSEGEKASYRALGVRTPCRTVPNGITPTGYRRQARGDLQARWGIPAHAQVVLFLGRIHSRKGADRLLEAFLKIAERCRQALLIMAGPDDADLERRFRATIQAAGLAARVRFTGMVLGADKLDLLARADVFCLPSQGEGFSLAVLEALASGTAVVLSPHCFFPEAAAAGAGCIVPVETEALARTLADLLAQPHRLRAMGEAGVKLVQQQYTWPSIARRLTVVYEEGIDRHRGRNSS